MSWPALAGLVAPIWFTLVVMLQAWLQPDYSDVAMPISALAAWPYGWLQRLNFFVFGPLMAVNALGLHRGIREARSGALALALLLVSAAGIVLAGISSWGRRPDGGFVEPLTHTVAAFMTFLGAGGGLVALSRRMTHDAGWRSLSRYVLACGSAMLVSFPLMGALAMRDGAPLQAYAGLLQRAILVVWFPCIVVLSVRLLRVARESR